MMNNNNPWAGLASYEDPSKSKRKLKFCGRDNDIYDVTRLIDDNLLLILYGKSGIGKTSLLNAGVFPKLRLEQYLPVSIRLGTLETKASYQEAIISAIENAIEEVHGNISVYDVVEEQIDNQEPDRLWNYFARHRFANAEQQPLFPVVVLDQFEEVLRNISSEHVGKAQILLNQLQYLIDESHALSDCIVDEKEYFYDFNFRFVISIREDELYLLEDNIDDLSLSMFRNCRYRLRSLSEQDASEAVKTPGKGYIDERQQDDIVKRIIALSKRPQSNDIDTLLLSLVCAGTFDKKSGNKITLSDLAIWKSNPMEVYYQDAIKDLSASQVRYIQQHLIREDGSRKRMNAEEVKTALGESTYNDLSQGKNRLLSLSENGQVELLHDQIAQAIYDERMKRKQKQIFLQRFFTNGIFDGIVLAFDMFVFVFMLTTQLSGVGMSQILCFFIGCILILSTYMQNVTRINHDNRLDAFILPQITSCLFVYFALSVPNLHAYHIIKPSMIHGMLNVFLWLNILLVFLSIISRITYGLDGMSNQIRWIDYFSIKRRENRFAQISLLSSIIIVILVLAFIPDTYPEQLRKRAIKGDSSAMIELGNYYMRYDRDVGKAREWYKAAAQDCDVNGLIDNTYERSTPYLSDTMKVEASIALLSNYSIDKLQVVNYLLDGSWNEDWEKGAEVARYLGDVLYYYDSIQDVDAVMRWHSFLTQRYHWGYGLLGYVFWQGEYVEQDMERAFELYVKGKSHNNVVLCYLHGWGVERSVKKAKEYIEIENCGNEIPNQINELINLLSLFENE